MNQITEKDFEKLKIQRISYKDLLNKNLKYHEEERVNLDDNTHIFLPVEKDLNKTIQENKEFWLKECGSSFPLLLVFHKKISEEQKQKIENGEYFPIKIGLSVPDEHIKKMVQREIFDRESFRIKYYCEKRCDILYYPSCDILNSLYNKKNIYFLVNIQEEIEIPLNEIESIFLVDLIN